MRVISGKYKGRNLFPPKSDARPTLDRTKETLFNILNFVLPSAKVLDLFAGSGQLGIECLSRGATTAVFCDNNREAVLAVKRNLSNVGENCKVYQCSFRECLAVCGNNFDVVLVDPPYNDGYYEEVLKLIQQFDVLSADGIVVCEHDAGTELPEEYGYLISYDVRKIGNVKFTFYRRKI